MNQKEKTDIRSLNLKELTVFMEQLGEKAFRAKQLYQGITQLQSKYPNILEQVYDSRTNFVYVRTSYDAQLYQMLLDASIAIRRFRGFLRICTGSSEENAALLEALTQILQTLSAKEESL